MNKIITFLLALITITAVSAQSELSDPIESLPKGAVFTFDKEIIIAPKQTTVVLGEGVTLYVLASTKERKISKGRTFTVDNTQFEGYNKGTDVAAELWFYLSFTDENIEFLEIFVGDRAVKGATDWNIKSIADLDKLAEISIFLPDIEEF